MPRKVIRMTELVLVAALLMVHGSLSFLADVDRLLDPSGGSVWLPVDHQCVNPVYRMIFLRADLLYSAELLER